MATIQAFGRMWHAQGAVLLECAVFIGGTRPHGGRLASSEVGVGVCFQLVCVSCAISMGASVCLAEGGGVVAASRQSLRLCLVYCPAHVDQWRKQEALSWSKVCESLGSEDFVGDQWCCRSEEQASWSWCWWRCQLDFGLGLRCHGGTECSCCVATVLGVLPYTTSLFAAIGKLQL